MKNVKQEVLQSRFVQSEHLDFLQNIQIKLIDKTPASDHTKWKFFSIKTFKTLYTDGLNIGCNYKETLQNFIDFYITD